MTIRRDRNASRSAQATVAGVSIVSTRIDATIKSGELGLE